MNGGLKSIGFYEIEYLERGIKNIKSLITVNDYNEYYKTIKKEIEDIEEQNKFKETEESKELKNKLKSLFGDFNFFHTDSPLFYAIKTGELILPKNQGGIHKVNINKIFYDINGVYNC